MHGLYETLTRLQYGAILVMVQWNCLHNIIFSWVQPQHNDDLMSPADSQLRRACHNPGMEPSKPHIWLHLNLRCVAGWKLLRFDCNNHQWQDGSCSGLTATITRNRPIDLAIVHGELSHARRDRKLANISFGNAESSYKHLRLQ